MYKFDGGCWLSPALYLFCSHVVCVCLRETLTSSLQYKQFSSVAADIRPQKSKVEIWTNPRLWLLAVKARLRSSLIQRWLQNVY